jgi:hypothetical protein
MSAGSGNGELLRADRSPQKLERAGVRRLNHIPLLICGAVAVAVAVLIAWTAGERAKTVSAKTEDHGGSTHDFAQAISGDKTGYIPPANSAPSATPPTALANAPPPVAAPSPPVANEEAEARKKAFFEALFATSAVNDPVLQQLINAHQQSITAAQAAKTVAADPNNLGGSTPAEIAEYTRKVADVQRSLVGNGPPPGPPDPNGLNTYIGNRDRWKLNTQLVRTTGDSLHCTDRHGYPSSIIIGDGIGAARNDHSPGQPGRIRHAHGQLSVGSARITVSRRVL